MAAPRCNHCAASLFRRQERELQIRKRMKLYELNTPALLLDMDAMERNLAKMARFFSAGNTRLRPHYKNHKCPALARRQIQAGAIGMTCATLSEAEALVANGIEKILISSEVAGAPKIRRFLDLASRAEIITVVDNPGAVQALSAAARRQRCRQDCQSTRSTP